MSVVRRSPRIAIVGAGIAGATCARGLAQAGCEPTVFDKSRGPGGRLATRRLSWVDRHGQPRQAGFDHGAPGFAATSPAFLAWVERAMAAGVLARWTPAVAPGSRPCDEGAALHLGLPDMPALCRWLLAGLPTRWHCAVDGLQHGPEGWRLQSGGGWVDGCFDAVVLTLPPAQLAPLLGPHRRDWAQRAALALMQPGWTLMGVTTRPAGDRGWDVGRPQAGPLAWVARNDARPGRAAAADEAHWVVHARAGWSRQHLEHPAEWVQPQLQSALQDWLGQPLDWQHAVVHRWRHARPVASVTVAGDPCWWDPALGLGCCGDALGGHGVEGAWQSGQALAERLLASPARAAVALATEGQP